MGTPLNSARFSGPGNYITQAFASTNVAVTVLPADASRKYLRIQLNYSGQNVGPLWITFDGSTPSTTNGLCLFNAASSATEYGNDLSVVEFGQSFVPTGVVKMAVGTLPASAFVIWA